MSLPSGVPARKWASSSHPWDTAGLAPAGDLGELDGARDDVHDREAHDAVRFPILDDGGQFGRNSVADLSTVRICRS
ncbi:hypothetical protein [Nonomuraea jabiensis]|uniref:Uncharacterized protein n=1 Tax=Nonomuraea jabiensis TaxID=882448 RepID=A0A7W9G745_9ACTN|nr:hypothetical protein [Nonomuraea jabiensis]MBB5778398.1 hypothetical protein [Nonomuraea jabiensis]